MIEYIVEKAGIDKKVALESQLRPGGNSITRKREERKEFRARQRWLEKNGFIKDNRSFFQKVRDVVLIPFLYIFLVLGYLLLIVLNAFMLLVNIFRMKSFKKAFIEFKENTNETINDLSQTFF